MTDTDALRSDRLAALYEGIVTALNRGHDLGDLLPQAMKAAGRSLSSIDDIIQKHKEFGTSEKMTDGTLFSISELHWYAGEQYFDRTRYIFDRDKCRCASFRRVWE